MEENVALDSSKQKQFVKSVTGIKKLIKKSEDKARSEGVLAKKTLKGRDGKDRKKKRKRGLVYLSHIPHGFYEHQMTQYFKQFGVVTNARVIRSKRTGHSKGCAFVEFGDLAVAQIVAETMNNYLMGKRLLKAVYIPPEKQRPAVRKNWSSTYNPGRENLLKTKKAYNADKDEKGDLLKARKLLANLSKTKTKLSELDINYDFFTPVDVPEVLLNDVRVKVEKIEEKDNVVAKKKKVKKGKKLLEADNEVNQKDDKAKVKITQKSNITNKHESKKGTKALLQDAKTTKKEQKQKKQTLKDKNVQPLEEFVKIGEDSDSDSSYAFDSDEYSKMVENEEESNSYESGNESDNEADSDDDIADGSDTSESDGIILRYEDSDEDLPPTPKQKTKPIQKAAQKVAPPAVKKTAKKQEAKKPLQMKRKAPEKLVSPKKPKFERTKQMKKLNKQFKKKK